ncbi:Spindle assembly abnormal protein 6 [Blattella germanica]|nr:Spindle assembly abnormal protein 6 [Blattella germanica]
MHGINFQNGEDAVDLLTSSEVIHCAQQKIFLKCKGKEDRNKFLRLMVSIVTVASPVSEKSVAIQITDDEDPFVLYMLIISEGDFQSIKEQQGLLIEYDNYHLMIEELPGEVFGVQQTLLKIIETNQFKQLCHLSLAIHVGTDSDIKKHMADNLTQSEARAKQVETRSQELIRRLEAKERENEQLKERWCEESKTIHAQTRLELSAERDSFAKSQEDLKKAFESEKRQLQDLLDDTKRNFESLISSLQAENKALFEQTCETESKIRDLTRKQTNFEKDFCTLQREAAMLRTQNSKLDSDYHEKEKNLNTLRMKFAVLEQALLEMNLNEKDDALQRRKTSLKSLSEELVKANEIIGKLNKELSVTKNKLKLRTNITLEQEVLLSDREKEIAALKKQVDECGVKLSQLENVEKQLQENLADAKTKLAEKDTTLSNNTNCKFL